jgi:hypothetical protein
VVTSPVRETQAGEQVVVVGAAGELALDLASDNWRTAFSITKLVEHLSAEATPLNSCTAPPSLRRASYPDLNYAQEPPHNSTGSTTQQEPAAAQHPP